MRQWVFLLAVSLISLVFLALGVGNALYKATLLITNTGSATSAIATPWEFSGQGLVDGGFVATTTLNASVTDVADLPIASMPAGARLDVKGAVADDGGSQTDETTEATDDSEDDMVLLPSSPTTTDAYYFGFDFPGRILTLEIGTAGVGDWIIVWEYYTSSGWSTLSDVDDQTEGFTEVGVKTVSYTIPRDWSSTTTESISAYWIRARVSSFTSITIPPRGTRAWWENGLWWSFVDSLSINEQKQYTLNLGGPDMVTNQQLFIGPQGITTTDSTFLELADDVDWELSISGWFDTSAARIGENVVEKLDSSHRPIRIWVSAENELTARIEDADLVTGLNLVLSDIESGEYLLTLDHNTSTDDHTFTVGSDSITSGNEITDLVDNSADWEWAQNGTMAYIDYIQLTGAIGGNVETTFSVAETLDDGFVYRTSNSYPPASDNFVVTAGSVEIRRDSIPPNYWINTGLIRWYTGDLPDDAVVTKVQLKAYYTDKQDADERHFTGEWYTAWPIDAADYTGASPGTKNAIAGWDITAINNNAWNTITLLNSVANLNLTGYSGLRFQIDSDEGLPYNQNHIFVSGYGSANAAELIVASYTPPEYGVLLLYKLASLPGLTVTDRSGNGHDGTMSYPSLPTSTISLLTMPLAPTPPAVSGQEEVRPPDVVSEVDPGEWQGDFDGSDIPLNDLWISLSSITGGDVPPIIYWIMFAVLATIVAGTFTFVITQSLMWSAAVIGMSLLAFVNFGGGLFPMWVFFFAAMMLAAVGIFSKVKSL